MIVFIFVIPINFADDSIDLTEDELQFIEEHPIITLGIDPSFYPFEFIDIDGDYNGLANEYIKLINEKTGLNMQIARNKTWSEAYIDAVEKNIDVLPCISKTGDREKYFLFSEPYYTFQRAIILKENSDVKNYKDLFGHTVAIQKNSSHQGYLEQFPEIDIHYYDTVDEALIAVADGKEEAFVGNLATSSHLISTHGLTELKYVIFESETSNYLHFAVRNDWPELHSIINKGLSLITEAERIEIQNKWIGMIKTVDYSGIIRIVVITFSVIIIATMVSIYWIFRLRKEIKKRIQIEKHLEIAKREAELANEIKSNFLARMSHEIRTPLNAITGLSYILYNTDLERSQKAHIEKIRHAASVMLSIINDILDFSKIEAGMIDIENEPFDLDGMIKNVLNIISFKIEEKELDFTLIKEPNMPNNFYGDSKRLEQILLNIINNAVKFTERGAITLNVDVIGFKRDEYQVEFRIKDTGIGMSDVHLEHLFEPFTQEDASISRRFGGTGLGLSIVKSLTEMLGGSIDVVSQLDEGTEFILVLTLKVNQEKELEVKSNFKYIKDIKTLVLNKKLNSLNLTNDYLKSFGITPEFTSSINQFIQMLTTTEEKFVHPYNLVVIDMESMTEEEFAYLESVFNREDLIKPHVILITPFIHDEKVLSNQYSILEKPVFPSILYNTIVDLFHFKVMASQMDRSIKYSKNDQNLTGKVLIVEDNKTNQLIAKSLLETIGVEVVLADHGKDANEKFDSEHFDIILMDLHMPVMNGYEAAKRIRAKNTTIPIIAMTADAVDGVKEKCHAFGMNHFISKPFDPEQFIFEVKTMLRTGEVNDDTDSILKSEIGLQQMGGDEKLYKQVLAVFLDENVETIQNINQSVEDKDYEKAIAIVHKIKSSAGSIGSEKVMNIASDLQKALIENKSEEIILLKEHFVEQVDLLLEKIRHMNLQ
ncbi:MAG: transporter substrate-binding domain-containing protein [Clostridiales bacterium]|nr:transporter substrate-binding domain-containing protein [Clostridiales bacterium]